jgi:predicted histone-like DNA-binding protein
MKIKLVERKNPSDLSKPAKWYANAVNLGTKDLKVISKDIAGRSSLTRGDIENVLSNFVDQLPAYLRDGFSVQLGEFGTLRLSLSSQGADTIETFNTATIEPRVIFTPSTSVKKELSDIPYEQA